MIGMDKEQDTAWRLWHLLEQLDSLLWERYESEFIERHLCEEDRRQAMAEEPQDPDPYPF
jgi:hypothetical protein